MTSLQTSTHDVVVIGGRCAGSATARLLAERGHDVVVLERATFPSDTLSTHGIARGGVVQLNRWGLLEQVLATGAPAVRDVTFAAGGREVTRRVKQRAGVDLLVAPRRTVLDALLADEATAAGATFLGGTAVTDLVRDAAGRVTGVASRGRDGSRSVHSARLVIGADGLRSTVARLTDARVSASFAADISLYYVYVDQVTWRGFEFHVADKAYAGVFPTHDGQACVWLSRPTPLLDGVRRAGAGRSGAFLAALDEVAPELGARVRTGRLASPVRACVAPPNFVRQAYGDGWALVGDAGYHRDPITGHGITDAFRDAELLADAAHSMLDGSSPEAEALSAYQAARDDSIAEVFRLTEELTKFPEPAEFVDLQIGLSEALDREAGQLASRPAPAGLRAATAA